MLVEQRPLKSKYDGCFCALYASFTFKSLYKYISVHAQGHLYSLMPSDKVISMATDTDLKHRKGKQFEQLPFVRQAVICQSDKPPEGIITFPLNHRHRRSFRRLHMLLIQSDHADTKLAGSPILSEGN